MRFRNNTVKMKNGLIAAAICGAAFASQTFAANATWVGGTDSAWTNKLNWSPNTTFPSANNTATFNQVSVNSPSISAFTDVGLILFTGSNVGNVEISGANTLNVDGLTLGTDTFATGILINNGNSGKLTISTTSLKLNASQSWINISPNAFTVNASVNLNGKTVTVGGSGATNFAGGSISSGTGALNKEGSGTLTLSGATNSYTGATTLIDGTLLVTGALSNSAATTALVTANGGTLGGTGTISRATTINSGAKLAPGVDANTAGTLKIDQSLTLGGTAAFDLVSAGSSDSILVNGSNASARTLTLGGALTVAAAPGFHFANGQVFDLFDWGAKTSVTGTFSSVQLPTLGSGLSWQTYGSGQAFDYSTGQISVVPEPASLAWIGLVGTAGLLRRRRAV